MNKEKLKKYIKGLLNANKKYIENGIVLNITDSFYSPKWLEVICNDILAILEGEDDE
jgi:hypothetical protein